ncbi:MAG: glycosyltransferase [Proteobacteria bacterium]|nr:glycosyltransferase [Pseudomonadota bacterium]
MATRMSSARPYPWPPVPASVFDILSSSNDNHSAGHEVGRADELDCLRRVLAPALLRAAGQRGRALGIGGDQVLIRAGIIDEETYLDRLAFHLELKSETFATVDRDDSPLLDRQIPEAARFGLIPLRQDGRLIWTLTPRGIAARTLCQLVARYRDLKPHIRLTSTSRAQQFLMQQGGVAMERAATRQLSDKWPSMSAAPTTVSNSPWRSRITRCCGVLALALPPLVIAPGILSSFLAIWFLGFVALRVTCSLWPRSTLPDQPRLSDDRLPVYSIIVALYREAASVAPLMRSLDALDYPREKLDIILAIEPNDLQTRAAIARLGPMPHVRVLIVPAVKPKTKPKALNCALPFAHGRFVAVFDAEDRPDPLQLRAALDAFHVHGADTACAQASLRIDNLTHSWLSRMFAIEYAGQFDAVLPGMVQLGLPLPLGGSSNHFRTDVLREVGGWDSHNVTEDADLGFRLARFGYRSVTFSSTTGEEAPIAVGDWLRQRTRWMKGWVQTWLVHMRRPWRLWREAGPFAFFTLNLIVGGNVLTALAYPILIYAFLARLIAATMSGAPLAFLAEWPAPLHLAAIVAGYLSTIVVGFVGLAKLGQLRRGWILALTPLYWLCLSAAAWRAVWHYIKDPYHWEKTQHGIVTRHTPAGASDAAASATTFTDSA